jgi:hypothetical protein
MGTSTKVRRRGSGHRVKAVAAVAAAVTAAVLAGAPAATAGTATVAAPSSFDVPLYHSSGTLVARLQGQLAWSTSGRTVSFTGQQLYVRTGECVKLVYAGYQSNTLVAASDPVDFCEASWLLGDRTLSTDKPGGIQHVIIELTDVAHGNKASGDCWKSESLCRSRP